MTYKVYPRTLPGCQTFNGAPVSQTIASADGGMSAVLKRRRSRQPNSLETVGWTFFEDDYETFVRWGQKNLLNWTSWFWIQLPSAGGVTWMRARFADQPVQNKVGGYRMNVVTANLEIRDRAFTPQAGPLRTFDTMTVKPARAYSLRRVLSAYEGPCIKVRRANGGALQDIGFDADDWLDEGALTTFLNGSSGYVNTWYDQSDNGKNAVQNSLNFQPMIALNGVVVYVNNYPCVFVNAGNLIFDNTGAAIDDFALSSVFSTTQSNGTTSVTVGYNVSGFFYNDMSGPQDDIGFGNLGNALTLWGGSVHTELEYGVRGSTPINDGLMHVGIANRVSSSGHIDLYLDSRLEASGTGAIGPRDATNTLNIGSAGVGSGTNGAGLPAIFYTPECLIFAAKLGSKDLSILQGVQSIFSED